MTNAERRKSPRRKTSDQARIYFNGRRSSIVCTIHDISEGGARLSFDRPVTVPTVIELHIPHRRECYRAEVRWQNGREIGVQMDNAEVGSVESPGLAPAADADVDARLHKLEQEMWVLRRRLDELQRQDN